MAKPILGALTAKEQRFVDVYCHDPIHGANATRSYMIAYELDFSQLSEEEREKKMRSLYGTASELTQKPKIKEAIEKEINKITPGWVKNRLMALSFDPRAKPADQIRATELLGKTHAMFVDTVQGEMAINTVFDPENEEK